MGFACANYLICNHAAEESHGEGCAVLGATHAGQSTFHRILPTLPQEEFRDPDQEVLRVNGQSLVVALYNFA